MANVLLLDLGIDRLSIEERVAVAEAIWESVIRDVEAAPLPAWQAAELERRLADSEANPDAVRPVARDRGSGSDPNEAMNLLVALRHQAAKELLAACDYLEARQAGLGGRLMQEVRRLLDRISTHPELHGKAGVAAGAPGK